MSALLDNLKFLLLTQGWAQLRYGERRSLATARKLMQQAADELDMTVKVVKGSGFVKGTVEE